MCGKETFSLIPMSEDSVLTNNLEDHSEVGSSRFRFKVLQSHEAVEGSYANLSSDQTFVLSHVDISCSNPSKIRLK